MQGREGKRKRRDETDVPVCVMEGEREVSNIISALHTHALPCLLQVGDLEQLCKFTYRTMVQSPFSWRHLTSLPPKRCRPNRVHSTPFLFPPLFHMHPIHPSPLSLQRKPQNPPKKKAMESSDDTASKAMEKMAVSDATDSK